MTLFHFLDLELDQQAAFVWRGECLATRVEGQQQVLLYRAGDFFAEIFYDSRERRIVYIKGFNTRTHLAPYSLYKPNI